MLLLLTFNAILNYDEYYLSYLPPEKILPCSNLGRICCLAQIFYNILFVFCVKINYIDILSYLSFLYESICELWKCYICDDLFDVSK